VKLDQTSAQQTAYEAIFDRIVDGDVAPGERISPAAIAESLGLSRMPVRDAVIRLATEGFVTMSANRGVFVSRFTAEEIISVFEMRSLLESHAARLCAGRIGHTGISELEDLLTKMSRLEGSPSLWLRTHDSFHLLIASLSNRPLIYAEIFRLRLMIRPYFSRYIMAAQEREILGHEHDQILDQLRCGDGTAAEVMVRAHVMENAENIATFSTKIAPKAPRVAVNLDWRARTA
jgi:DNA-binding GntR family transcriptional regulator